MDYWQWLRAEPKDGSNKWQRYLCIFSKIIISKHTSRMTAHKKGSTE
jgi:hypothetical protein